MQALRARLDAAGLLRDAAGAAPAFPVWADDSVLPFAFGTAEALRSALPQVASIVHDTFAQRAMSLNYGAGKSEALLRLTVSVQPSSGGSFSAASGLFPSLMPKDCLTASGCVNDIPTWALS